jgi:hypothetical protein
MLGCAVTNGQETSDPLAGMIRVKNSPAMFRKMHSGTARVWLTYLLLIPFGLPFDAIDLSSGQNLTLGTAV